MSNMAESSSNVLKTTDPSSQSPPSASELVKDTPGLIQAPRFKEHHGCGTDGDTTGRTAEARLSHRLPPAPARTAQPRAGWAAEHARCGRG